MPKTKLLGSKPGAEARATMSPLATSITAAAALCAGHALHGVGLQAEVEGELRGPCRRCPRRGSSSRMTRPAALTSILMRAGLAAQVGLEARSRRRSCRSGSAGFAAAGRGPRAWRDRSRRPGRRSRPPARCWAVGVEAAEADLGDHAGKDRGVGRDPHHVVPGEVLGDHHGDEGAAAGHLLQRALAAGSGGSAIAWRAAPAPPRGRGPARGP